MQKDNTIIQKEALYRKIMEKLGKSEKIKGLILFGEEAKANQRNGANIQAMLVCSDISKEDFELLRHLVHENFEAMAIELVLWEEIVDIKIKKDILEHGLHCVMPNEAIN